GHQQPVRPAHANQLAEELPGSYPGSLWRPGVLVQHRDDEPGPVRAHPASEERRPALRRTRLPSGRRPRDEQRIRDEQQLRLRRRQHFTDLPPLALNRRAPMNRTLTALLALTLAGVAQADPAADGKIVFEENCVKCHGDDGRARTWRGWMFFAEDLSDAEWQDR